MRTKIGIHMAAALLALSWAATAFAQEVNKAQVAVVVAPQVKPVADASATHEKIADVSVTSTDGKHRLQTVGIAADGRVLALAAPPKGFGPPVQGAAAEVHVFSPDGKSVTIVKVDFHASSIAGGPDGNIYVAGEGKVVRYGADCKAQATFELPFIKELLADKTGPRKAAEQMAKQQRESMAQIVVQYKDNLKKLEAKKEEDRTALEKRQIEQYRQLVKQYEPQAGKDDNLVEQLITQLTGRLRTINAITFSAKDVFLVCGSSKGFGYAIWRLDHNFQNAKQVLAEVRGCCGQMDIQTSGDDLLVAENTSHRFGRYDRDGKLIGAWGKRSAAAGDLECFGGCCNPMNLCSTSKGEIFTAESEGFIKRFSPKGDFLGLVASVPLSGAGCKNVAFAVNRDESRIYFLDLNGSKFVILARKNGKG